ncbi:MAG TPA: hypothetical protein VFB14_21880 [Bryobacteraceae bacterium]|jgi:hypothetical protein|nr:hypothetical protein [Bryobacteraceae bacterium]HZU42379.1 hypothetical protein [Terriglobales bacterium]
MRMRQAMLGILGLARFGAHPLLLLAVYRMSMVMIYVHETLFADNGDASNL